jgi:methylthioribose-1-phosphate isomerase
MHPASGVFLFCIKLIILIMKSKNNSIFLQMRHHSDVSTVIKLSQTMHGAPVIEITARYAFGLNT